MVMFQNILKSTTRLFVLFILLSFSLCLLNSIKVSAADARNYNAGNIISDAIFTNDDSMSVNAIQNFLNSKVSCDTWGVEVSSLGGGTRAQYLAARGIQTPIKCINDYYENINTGENNYSKSNIPSGAISAAEIIYKYSKQFNINPQVIIVTLQKENGLITDEWPLPIQYTQAMGFGCPDNVAAGVPACDPSYGSFSSQVYQAARHFRGYIDNLPGWYVSFDTGLNTVKWNPNGSCGTSSFNIENRSTVALYTYTPYRPNQAALNAQYGTGDNCSSYGNRNFYLYFTDWFGSTQFNYSIVRTVDDGRLYLVNGNMKYYIPSMYVYEQLKVISNIGFVGSDYLNNLTTSPLVASKFVRNVDNGAIYLIDSGYKIHFTSCSMVTDYGFDCANAIGLSSAQIAKYRTGPNVTNLFSTIDGQRFYIKSGQKREVLDNKSLELAGLSGFTNTLSSNAVSHLPYGVPVIRDDVMYINKSDNTLWYYYQNKIIKIENTPFLRSKSSGYMNQISASKLSVSSGSYKGFIKLPDGKYYVLSNNSRVLISQPAQWGVTFLDVGHAFDNISVDSSKDSTIIKSDSESAVYKVYGGFKHYLISGIDIVILSSGLNNITTTSKLSVDSISSSDRVMFGPSQLVKNQGDGKVYVINGLSGSKIYLPSFKTSNDLGFKSEVRTVSDAGLSKYQTESYNLINKVTCNSDYYFGVGGVLYKFDDGMLSRYGFTKDQFIQLSDETCKYLSVKTMVAKFLRSPSTGVIYYINNGRKTYIGSYSQYVSLGGGDAAATLSDVTNNLINSVSN